ncbi:MAG: SDR family NAD(P)-dependent oxidoreductase, partial [Minwuia sp.]|nr:SDR family NAD(P)-dependent oxidoreductase [Minwuia sp.]
MTDLKDKVAIVTGAARHRGIGRAIALRLARDGADVVVSARSAGGTIPAHEQEMEWRGTGSLVTEIEALGRRALSLDCDVTDREQVLALVDGTLYVANQGNLVSFEYTEGATRIAGSGTEVTKLPAKINHHWT